MNYTNISHFYFFVPLLVSYNVHFAHKYLQCRTDKLLDGIAAKQKQKVIFALEKTGPAVLHASASLFLAVLPLGLARSFILVNMFKIWMMMIVFGTIHALFFLPALLGIVGPLNEYDEQIHFERAPDTERAGLSLGPTGKTVPTQ